MKNLLWAKTIKSCPDPQRAKHFFGLLASTNAGPKLGSYSAEQIRALVALFSGSQVSSNLLIANPHWLDLLEIDRLRNARRFQGFHAEVGELLKPILPCQDYAAALGILRKFKQREMVRIALRDLARLSNVPEITREISDLADVCLSTVLRVCREDFAGRFGQPYHQDVQGRWNPTAFCVLGLGKLGAQELNYSSDVDIMLLYGDEGEVFKSIPSNKKSPRPVMSNHQFFSRLGETFVGEVGRMTGDGFLFRIDLRLRPEGDVGPLCRSLESYENYYAQWGQTWERMMLIKARGVAGDTALAGEFLETIQSFRFPRSTGEGVLCEIAATKNRIETEIVGEAEMDRNVKLGRGGIREVEFVVQALQLMHAGRQPFLQITQTLPCLTKLAQYKLLTDEQATQLADAYCFLRNVEHRLQMDENLQTHTIPEDPVALKRLAKLMGLATSNQFEAARKLHTQNVRCVYDGLFKVDSEERESPFPARFDGAEVEWKSLLTRHRFRDVDKAFAVLKEFVEGPGYVNVSLRTMELARRVLPKLFALCPQSAEGPLKELKTNHEGDGGRIDSARVLSDPDRVVTRLDSFITAYGARSMLFELWNSNPAIFELLLMLFDRSEFLAEVAIRTPDLVDDLVSSGRLRRRKTVEETLADLRHGLYDKDQYSWLRRYHESEFMRIGLRDILGLADFEQSGEELSALADACLQFSLESAMRRNQYEKPPLVIIGLGKLGGLEIDYGSDLDILFVADSKSRDLSKLQRLAAEVMELMSRRTEQGMVFTTDARLRPDGEKGLLVNTISAHEHYYRERAQLWEIQSLTRVRAVAGHMTIGEQFRKMTAELTNFKKPGKPPFAYTADWKRQIHRMRMRIEKDRTQPWQDELAIKTGGGGLMDAEFIAQTLCLEHGLVEANTLRVLEFGRDAGVLPDANHLLKSYRQLRRVESILRRWSYEGETVLPEDSAAYYRVAVRCGFATPEEFRTSLLEWRAMIRKVYLKCFKG